MLIPSAFPFQTGLLKTLNIVFSITLGLLLLVWLPTNIISTKAFFLALNGTDTQATVTNIDACDPNYDTAHLAYPTMHVTFTDQAGNAQQYDVDCLPDAKQGARVTVRYGHDSLGNLNAMTQKGIDAIIWGPRGVGTLAAVVALIMLIIFSRRRLKFLGRLSETLYKAKEQAMREA
jgi:hypothetical protein